MKNCNILIYPTRGRRDLPRWWPGDYVRLLPVVVGRGWAPCPVIAGEERRQHWDGLQSGQAEERGQETGKAWRDIPGESHTLITDQDQESFYLHFQLFTFKMNFALIEMKTFYSSVINFQFKLSRPRWSERYWN